jgi:hypothetical protein
MEELSSFGKKALAEQHTFCTLSRASFRARFLIKAFVFYYRIPDRDYPP